MVNTLSVGFTQDTSIRDHITSFDEVVHNEDMILDYNPKEDVDLRNKAREPSFGPNWGLALDLLCLIACSSNVKTTSSFSPHNGILVM